jgi:hypothetical protein
MGAQPSCAHSHLTPKIGTLKGDRRCKGNLAWGEDGSSLFITSNQNVYRLKLKTKGAGL